MSLTSRLSSLLRSATRSPAVRRAARDLGEAALRATRDDGQRRTGLPADGPADGAAGSGTGREGAPVLADRTVSVPLSIAYAPRDDDDADPGEIVWAWVHYEEDMTQGKDRPVLVIGLEPASAGGTDGTGSVLVALMLTSRDRTPSGGTITDEHGATWVDIGSGDWDRQGRESEVRADRLLRLAPGGVRREGGRLGRDRFERVADAVREVHGWR